jgi:hypothetical protein
MREGKLIASGTRVDVRNNIGATALMFASSVSLEIPVANSVNLLVRSPRPEPACGR